MVLRAVGRSWRRSRPRCAPWCWATSGPAPTCRCCRHAAGERRRGRGCDENGEPDWHRKAQTDSLTNRDTPATDRQCFALYTPGIYAVWNTEYMSPFGAPACHTQSREAAILHGGRFDGGPLVARTNRGVDLVSCLGASTFAASLPLRDKGRDGQGLYLGVFSYARAKQSVKRSCYDGSPGGPLCRRMNVISPVEASLQNRACMRRGCRQSGRGSSSRG